MPGAAVIETDRWADSVLAKTQSIVIYFIPTERERGRERDNFLAIRPNVSVV